MGSQGIPAGLGRQQNQVNQADIKYVFLLKKQQSLHKHQLAKYVPHLLKEVMNISLMDLGYLNAHRYFLNLMHR